MFLSLSTSLLRGPGGVNSINWSNQPGSPHWTLTGPREEEQTDLTGRDPCAQPGSSPSFQGLCLWGALATFLRAGPNEVCYSLLFC